MSQQSITVGAVAYDPKVVTIWEGMREYFRGAGVPTDYVLFSNYEAQVDALFARTIDLAWNTNVAYVRCLERAGGLCQTLAMRNTDIGFTTRVVARADAEISSLAQLRGKRLALGSADSAQAAILPIHYLEGSGLEPGRDVTLLRFDIDVGKHGDTGLSELEVLKAVHDGRADAGAVGDPTWIRELEQGHVNPQLVRSIWTSPPYCHCNFTALPDFNREISARWTAALLAMDFNHPQWHRVMELEGLSEWLPGRHDGYQVLMQALGIRLPESQALPLAGRGPS